MKPFDCMTAAHMARMQLSGILCERELTKEENLLHVTSSRLLTRYFALNDENIRVANEETTRLPDSGTKKIPPGEEPGLLPSN